MIAIAHNSLPDNLRLPLVFSCAFHSLLLGSLILSTFLTHRGELWGGSGGGGAMTVGLVRSIAGVPLPRPETVTPSRVVDETRGLHKSEPRPPEPETSAKQIPEFSRNKPPRYVTRPSRVLENETPPLPGAIPYGQGGAPSLPYTQFNLPGSSSQGGLGFSGPGGEFSARFPWYVEAVRRRISANWLQAAVDPSIRWAPRVVVSFQVLRDGAIVNIELLRASGTPSVDNSAVRAVRDASPLERLPSDYAGSHVVVEFWFDFRR